MIKKVYLIAPLLFSVLSIIYLSYDDNSIINSFVLFSFLGSILFKRGKLFSHFLFSYLVNVSFIFLFTQSYIQDTGEIFMPGGDAERFYKSIIDIVNGDYSYYFGRYKLFLFIVSSYYEFIIYCGIGSISPYHFILFSCFCVSLGNVFVFKIYNQFLDLKSTLNIFLIVALFPLIIKFATTTLREVYAYPFVFIYIYYFLNLKRKKIAYFYILLSIFVIAGIRLEWLLGIFSFSFFYIISGSSFKKKIQSFLLIGVISVLFLVVFNTVVNFIGYDGFDSYDLEKFKKIMNDEDSLRGKGSIANKLINYGIIGRFFLFFFTVITPFPPPIVKINQGVLEPLLISIGAIYYYYNLPIMFFTIKKMVKVIEYKKIIFGFIGMIISVSILLTFTTIASYRHKLFLFPILLSFIPLFNQFYDKKIKKDIYVIMTLIIVVFLISYFILKS